MLAFLLFRCNSSGWLTRRRELQDVRQSLLVEALAGVLGDWSACGAALHVIVVRLYMHSLSA